jgi:D,D-heptose 1,7-bisphosphate phosphatase
MNKAVFLDKDGTLVYNVPYNVNPEKVKFYEDVFDGLRLLQEHGFKLVVITNQPGVALGYFGEEELQTLGNVISNILQREGIKLDGFYYCPHFAEGPVAGFNVNCNCRKPAPGLIKRAASDLHIDLSNSYMIGDILNDVEAGNGAGCRSILIKNGNETEWFFNKQRVPAYIVSNFKEACNKIIQDAEVKVKGGMYERRFEKSY